MKFNFFYRSVGISRHSLNFISMPNNFLQAIKNASDAFFETMGSKPQYDESESIDKPILKDDDEGISVVDDQSQTGESGNPKHEKDEAKSPIVADDSDVNCKVSKSLKENKAKVCHDNPEVRLKTTEDLSSGGYVVGFSMQGRGHIMTNIPCQDYHAFEDLGDGWLVAITSDGAGSAREAARGSKANCELALSMVKRLLASKGWQKNNYLPSEKEWYAETRNMFEVMQAVIVRSAASQVDSYRENLEKSLATLMEEAKNVQDAEKAVLEKRIKELEENLKIPLEPRDFNATVILLIVSPKGMMAAHIGDGRMGYLSKEGVWKSLMTPHKGDEASSTVFVPNNWNRQLDVPSFMMSGVYLPESCVIEELPKAFVLMSDGCESFSWTCMTFDKERNLYYDRNEPFEKFLNPLIDQLGQIEDKNERVDEMIDIVNIGTVGGKKELDDRTMLLGVLE